MVVCCYVRKFLSEKRYQKIHFWQKLAQIFFVLSNLFIDIGFVNRWADIACFCSTIPLGRPNWREKQIYPIWSRVDRGWEQKRGYITWLVRLERTFEDPILGLYIGDPI